MSDYISEFAIFREVTDWEKVRKEHLLPNIQNVQDYNRELRAGVEHARKFLQDCPTVPSVADLQKAHTLMFERLYSDAGRIREEGDKHEAEGQRASPGKVVAKDLATLETTSRLEFSTTEVEKRIEAASLHHAGMEMIRPFETGNGEISRLVLGHQLWKEFKTEQTDVGRGLDKMDWRVYSTAMERARTLGQQGSTLMPLKDFVTDFSRQTLQVGAEQAEKTIQQAIAELESQRKK